MGASHSKDWEHDLSLFSAEDRDVVLKLFGANSADSLPKVPRAKLFDELLLKCSKEHETFVERFCDLLSEFISKTSHISLKSYVACAARLLKEPVENRADIVIFLASGRKEYATSSEMLWYLETIVSLFEIFSMLEAAYKGWKPHLYEDKEMLRNLGLQLGGDLFMKNIPVKERHTSEFEESKHHEPAVAEWLTKNHVLGEIHTMLYTRIFNLTVPANVAPIIPSCFVPPGSETHRKYLSFPEIVFINTSLPLEVRKEWRLLFSTSAHGESFSTMLGKALDKGPVIVFIEDKHGHRFGGFAAEEWRVGPHYYGKPSALLFSLKPKMALFRPTGFNDHYQYLNVKCHTFPNGLGFGGQLEYFGIWIDSDFGKGYCSPSCITYDSPQLSHDKEFQIHHLEVWGVGQEPKKEVSERISILDADMEAVAMMKIVGRDQVSEGIRECPTADIPGEKVLRAVHTDLYGSSP